MKNSIDVYKAQGKTNVLLFDPEDLHLVTEPDHPLFDERVHLPIHEPTVLNMMHQGVLQAITINKNPETGRVEVVDGRQRVKNAREANKRLRAKGCEPIMVPGIPRRADAADLAGVMVSSNELRQSDTPIGRAKKMAALQRLGKDEDALAVLFGCTKATVRKTISLLDLTVAAQVAVDAGVVTLAQAAEVGKLPPEKQRAKVIEIEAAGAHLNGHAKARAKRTAASNGAEAPKMRTRKEILGRLAEMSKGSQGVDPPALDPYRDALSWVLNGVTS